MRSRLPTTLLTTALSLSLLPTLHACLTQNDATTLATNFGTLVTSYNQKLANETLAPNFIDYSESVNSLIDAGGSTPVPLLGETFASRAQFESASAQQPSVPFTVKNVWFTCDTVTFRWESDQSPKPVVGISVGHTVFNPALAKDNAGTLFQFDEIWGEFDSAAWLTNLGLLVQPSQKSKRRGRGD